MDLKLNQRLVQVMIQETKLHQQDSVYPVKCQVYSVDYDFNVNRSQRRCQATQGSVKLFASHYISYNSILYLKQSCNAIKNNIFNVLKFQNKKLDFNVDQNDQKTLVIHSTRQLIFTENSSETQKPSYLVLIFSLEILEKW